MEEDVLEIPEFPRKFTEVLYGYQQEHHLCDCLIITNNGFIPAHRLVLVMTSPYLHQIESRRKVNGCKSRDRNFVISYQNDDVLAIVRLLYTGKLFISKNNSLRLAEICRFLQLREALTACEKYMKSNDIPCEIDSTLFSSRNEAIMQEESDCLRDNKKSNRLMKDERVQNLCTFAQMKNGRNLDVRPPVHDISSKCLMVNGVLLKLNDDGRLILSKNLQNGVSQKINHVHADDNTQTFSMKSKSETSSSVKGLASAACTVNNEENSSSLPTCETSSSVKESASTALNNEKHSGNVLTCETTSDVKEAETTVNDQENSSHLPTCETSSNVNEQASSPFVVNNGDNFINLPTCETSSVVKETEPTGTSGEQFYSMDTDEVNCLKETSENEYSQETESDDGAVSDVDSESTEADTLRERKEEECVDDGFSKSCTKNVDMVDNMDQVGDNKAHDENSQKGSSSDATILSESSALSDAESSGDEWSPGGSTSDDRIKGGTAKKRKQVGVEKVKNDVKRSRRSKRLKNFDTFSSVRSSRSHTDQDKRRNSTGSTKSLNQQAVKRSKSSTESSCRLKMSKHSTKVRGKGDIVVEKQSENSIENSLTSGVEQNSISTTDISENRQDLSDNESHNTNRTYSCFQCKMEFEDPKELVRHRKEKHRRGRKLWTCEICQKQLLRKVDLDEHKFKSHNIPFNADEYELHKCPHENCTYTSLKANYIRQHLRYIHGNDGRNMVRATCETCGKNFTEYFKLNRHLKTHLNKEDRIVCTCSICGRGFITTTHLKNHMKYVHMKKKGDFLCHLCPYTAKDKSGLANHQLKSHEYKHPDYEILKCRRCDFQTVSKKDFTRHMLVHENTEGKEKQYQCSICDRSFVCLNYLKAHEKNHKAEMIHCEFEGCKFSTNRQIRMKNHIRGMHTDTDYKPFKCHLCDHACKLKGNLHKHLLGKHKVKVTTLFDRRKEALTTGKGYFDLQKEFSTDYTKILMKKAHEKDSD
ncbi:hypothetical protein FSP39_007519 [Pinctada imbricata]|uniref:Uncharacterized protein n=1 Tax=Pinctada imbricata TaxID=66713 RepID=A0AA88XQM8_PINIB|nr:hypothetical protein FSP39_007519 [Pinctada imbricata]